MAHGDYHCCALCDCKLDYSYDARTKEDLCLGCMRALHEAGIPVYCGADLAVWINTNPERAVAELPGLGLSECFYTNAVDAAFTAAKQDTAP